LLVADDDPLSRKHVVKAASRWGYDVIAVSDGASALATLLAPDAPRLAIFDWEMPKMSGVEVCRLLRGRESPYVYVVLLTSLEGRRPVIDGLSAGADDYLKKPFDEQELEVRLRAGRRIVQLQESLLNAQAELQHRAAHDPLTGTKNRGAVVEAFEAELCRVQRTGNAMSLIMVDIDHFKRVNDTYGHASGDGVLQSFCRRVTRELRRYDVLGRLGGEEFLIVAPHTTLEQAAGIAERLRRRLCEAPIDTPGGPVSVTASFGVVSTLQGYGAADKLLAAADGALYEAKGCGRNRVKCAPDAAAIGSAATALQLP
jgi:diguanylate cyclase (GGDEF)-like protein